MKDIVSKTKNLTDIFYTLKSGKEYKEFITNIKQLSQ